MFIFTTRLTRRKLFICIGIAAVLICGVAMLVSSYNRAEATGVNLPARKNIKTLEDRIGFLSAYGWQTDGSSEMSQEVIIPKEFDSVFEEYNNMQKEQGFDLSKYKGKRVMRYVYLIKNHPENREIVYAGVLIYKNTVIGGDVQCPEMDGFMHGFERPDNKTGTIEPSGSPSPSA